MSLARFTAIAALTTAIAGPLAACGHNVEQRAATGAIAGAVVAGPVGAAVGGAAGVVVDKVAR
ncbi:MAG: hypothetical protein BGN86_04000 [Caulobacterales bacterium 68-7]|mgnify:CR=1 FL=1|nr:hypothetical protein [Caulobacterales bacterium]OJU08784.1 MAG: hypothetical protein BGN86_04000 [Caulobacterales bacterium 68-7]